MEGNYKRCSLKTKSWERAVVLSRKMEEIAEAEPVSGGEAVTIARAVQEYLADARARELAPATLYKLEIIFHKQLLAWSKVEGYKLLREFDLRAAQAFRTSWTDGPLAKKKKQERMTGFFWFAMTAHDLILERED